MKREGGKKTDGAEGKGGGRGWGREEIYNLLLSEPEDM